MGITSVLWRIFSTVEGTFSTVGYLQYMWEIASVRVGDSFSTVGDTFSTVEVYQYSVTNITTVGDSFSTVEGIQYIWRITSVHDISTVWLYHQYCGGYSVQWGKNFNFGMFVL